MRHMFDNAAMGFSRQSGGGGATLGFVPDTYEGIWIGDPGVRIEMPDTGPRLDNLSANLVVNRWANKDVLEISQLSWTATLEEVEATAMVDLVFGVPPRFSGHQNEEDCPGVLLRSCRENRDLCPPSTFMCPVPPLSWLEYMSLFPLTGPGNNRAPGRFLGIDGSRTIWELRPSIENILRLYKVIQSAGALSNMWLQIYRAEVSQIAQGNVSMPRSFMEMELTLIVRGAPFTLTGLGIPAFLPVGVELTWDDVADALMRIMTMDELIEMAADLNAIGAIELSNAIDLIISPVGDVPPIDDLPPGDKPLPGDKPPPIDDLPPGAKPLPGDKPPPVVYLPPGDKPPPVSDIPPVSDLPPVAEPIVDEDAISLLLGGGLIAAALALS